MDKLELNKNYNGAVNLIVVLVAVLILWFFTLGVALNHIPAHTDFKDISDDSTAHSIP